MILFNDANECTHNESEFRTLANRGRFILLRLYHLSSSRWDNGSWGLMATFHSEKDCYDAFNRHREIDPDAAFRVADIGYPFPQPFHYSLYHPRMIQRSVSLTGPNQYHPIQWENDAYRIIDDIINEW